MGAKERLTEMMENEVQALQKLESEVRTATARIGAFRQGIEALGTGEELAVMSRRLQEKMKKEESRVEELQASIVDGKGRVSAFEEALRLFPKEGEEFELRAGSQLADVRRVLKERGQPMALTDILLRIGKSADDPKGRNSLRGSLSKYAQDGRVFTKEEAPDTFGLIEFRSQSTNNV